jgi:tetratricopeptide (TPR) repeat protein
MKRSISSRLIACALVALSIAGSSVPLAASAKSYVKAGNVAYFKLNYEEALKKYLEADKKMKADDREYAIAMLNIASAYRRVGNYEKSVEYFDKASEKIWGPKSGWQSANLGFGTGVLTNESKQEWIGTENERLYMRFFSAVDLLQLGQVDDSLIAFKLAERVSENYPSLRYFHGYASTLVPEERAEAAVHLRAAAAAVGTNNKLSVNPYPDLRLATWAAGNNDMKLAEEHWAKAASALEANPLLKDRAAVLKSGTNLILLIERGWAPVNAKDKTAKLSVASVKIDGAAAGNASFLDYSGQHEKIGSAEAMKSLGAGLATELGKDALKNVGASIVPGGGLVMGMFMGGKRDKSVATWDKVPPAMYLYETRVPAGAHKVEITFVDEKGKAGASVTHEITVPPSGAKVVSVPVAIKK